MSAPRGRPRDPSRKVLYWRVPAAAHDILRSISDRTGVPVAKVAEMVICEALRVPTQSGPEASALSLVRERLEPREAPNAG